MPTSTNEVFKLTLVGGIWWSMLAIFFLSSMILFGGCQLWFHLISVSQWFFLLTPAWVKVGYDFFWPTSAKTILANVNSIFSVNVGQWCFLGKHWLGLFFVDVMHNYFIIDRDCDVFWSTSIGFTPSETILLLMLANTIFWLMSTSVFSFDVIRWCLLESLADDIFWLASSNVIFWLMSVRIFLDQCLSVINQNALIDIGWKKPWLTSAEKHHRSMLT